MLSCIKVIVVLYNFLFWVCRLENILAFTHLIMVFYFCILAVRSFDSWIHRLFLVGFTKLPGCQWSQQVLHHSICGVVGYWSYHDNCWISWMLWCNPGIKVSSWIGKQSLMSIWCDHTNDNTNYLFCSGYSISCFAWPCALQAQLLYSGRFKTKIWYAY